MYVVMEETPIFFIDDIIRNTKTSSPIRHTAHIHGVVPAKRDALKPQGQWNAEEIVADGSKIKVTVNGKVVVDADLSTIKETADVTRSGDHNAKGYIGFLGHGDPVGIPQY